MFHKILMHLNENHVPKTPGRTVMPPLGWQNGQSPQILICLSLLSPKLVFSILDQFLCDRAVNNNKKA